MACVPCGEAAQGFPVGLQVVGRRLREDRVLAAAAAYAQARPEKSERWEIPLSKAVKLDYEMVTPGMRTGADRK